MKRILFLGDSITDAGRRREQYYSMGEGYAMLLTAKLSYEYPQQYECINRGISGNRIVDIYSRVKVDCWNLEPDVLSFLIGVNDVWHEYDIANGVEPDRFEAVYRMFLKDTLTKLPNARIILLEPFVLKGSATEEVWEGFDAEVRIRAAIVKKLAEEFNLEFVPLQEKFDEAAKATDDTSYWLKDGVHPTPAGHKLIADAWEEVFFAGM